MKKVKNVEKAGAAGLIIVNNAPGSFTGLLQQDADIPVASMSKETGENGIRMVFKDEGPGIADVSLAMKDGYSSGKSLGLGLPGTQRLVSEFHIESVVGKGTTVTVIRWKNG